MIKFLMLLTAIVFYLASAATYSFGMVTNSQGIRIFWGLVTIFLFLCALGIGACVIIVSL